MTNIIPPPIPAQPAVNIVQVSSAQVYSAAFQNVFIAALVGYLIAIGRVSVELGLPALLGIAGIDLYGRLRAKASPLAAVAVGATGFLSRLPHLLVGLALGGAFLSGCAGLLDAAPTTPAEAGRTLRSALDTATWVCTLPVAEDESLRSVCIAVGRARREVGSP